VGKLRAASRSGRNITRNFGRLGAALPSAEQDHTLYAALDIDLKPWVFNVGLGRGLTGAADDWTLKFHF